MRYRIEARVTDSANREIAGAASVVATHGSFLVNIESDQYVYEPGQTATFNVEARDYDGGPIQTPVHAALIEHVWKRPEGAPAPADRRANRRERKSQSLIRRQRWWIVLSACVGEDS